MSENKVFRRKNFSFILNLFNLKLSLNFSTLGHPSRDVKKLVRISSLEPREEIWATDLDLGAIYM